MLIGMPAQHSVNPLCLADGMDHSVLCVCVHSTILCLILMRQSLTEAGVRLEAKPSVPPTFIPHSPGVTGMHTHTRIFIWMLGMQKMVLMLKLLTTEPSPEHLLLCHDMSIF